MVLQSVRSQEIAHAATRKGLQRSLELQILIIVYLIYWLEVLSYYNDLK